MSWRSRRMSWRSRRLEGTWLLEHVRHIAIEWIREDISEPAVWSPLCWDDGRVKYSPPRLSRRAFVTCLQCLAKGDDCEEG